MNQSESMTMMAHEYRAFEKIFARQRRYISAQVCKSLSTLCEILAVKYDATLTQDEKEREIDRINAREKRDDESPLRELWVRGPG